MNDLRTHRGFLVAAHSSTPGYLASGAFDKLLEHIKAQPNTESDFEFVRDVIRQAKGLLFRDGRNILFLQLNHPSSRWVLSFVDSTLDYLMGRSRRISIANYVDLLQFHPVSDTRFDHSANAEKARNWRELAGLDPDRFIQRWLSQPGGLIDLVQALHLIGGSLPEEWHKHPVVTV